MSDGRSWLAAKGCSIPVQTVSPSALQATGANDRAVGVCDATHVAPFRVPFAAAPADELFANVVQRVSFVGSTNCQYPTRSPHPESLEVTVAHMHDRTCARSSTRFQKRSSQ